MAQYAAQTQVSAEKSKFEIERTLQRYGATSFMYGTTASEAVVAFEAQDRRVRFRLPLPDRNSQAFTHSTRGLRTPDAAAGLWEQACRQRWRALALVIKAKLEAIEAGITTFEDEFLAHIMLPDGRTVGEHTKPAIALSYREGTMLPLLPAPH